METGIKKTIDGYQVWFKIDNQTFHLDEHVEETNKDSLEVARFFERMLKVAFKKLKMTPKEFYESLQEKKPFTELTSTGISDNLPNVFEFAKMYAEAINYTRCCEELKDKEVLSFEEWLSHFKKENDCYWLNKETLYCKEVMKLHYDDLPDM